MIHQPTFRARPFLFFVVIFDKGKHIYFRVSVGERLPYSPRVLDYPPQNKVAEKPAKL